MRKIPLIIGWLVRLYPQDFRREYGADLVDTVAQRAADAGQRGDGLSRFWLREGLSLGRAALRARWDGWRAGRSRGSGLGLRGWTTLGDQLVQETRQSLRRLLRTPVFGIAAVLTLALAIGANAAIYTLVRRVVLDPFPYGEAAQLVMLEHSSPEIARPGGIGITTQIFLEYRETVREFEDVSLFQNTTGSVRIGTLAEQVHYARVTPNLSGVLRNPAQLGRWFGEDEARYGQPAAVAVLSHRFWQRAFGGDASVLERSVVIDGYPLEIIGVMPARFHFPEPETEIWVPYAIPPVGRRDRGFNFEAIGRLRADVSVADLGKRLNALLDVSRSRADLQILRDLSVSATPLSLRDRVLGNAARALWILFGAVGLVLLIACANVANLFLVRVESTRRDLALRRALGASRSTVVLYFLTETLLLGLVAGALGFVGALAAVRILVRLAPADLPRLDNVGIDASVALFTLVVALVSGIVLGALPLLRAGGNVAGVMREASRGNTSVRGQRGRNAMAAAQIALALVLLIGAGLMLRSYQRLRQKPLGFQTEQRLMFRLTLSEREYPSREAANRFHEQLRSRIGALPGVDAVSATTCFVLEPCWGADFFVEGSNPVRDESAPMVWHRRVAPDYFRTMGTRVVRGRDFGALDFERRTGAVLINQALADAYWPGRDPIGQRVYTAGSAPDSAAQWQQVLGVVENMAGLSLTEAKPIPQLYLPLNAPAPNSPWPHIIAYVVRTSVAPLNLVEPVRDAVADLNPNLPVVGATTVAHLVSNAGAQMAFTMVLLSIAAAVALLLGIIGVYAVISYSVSQRSAEVGVRMALGASPAQVIRMILREGSTVIVVGVIFGLVTARMVTRALNALLFGVSPADPGTYLQYSLTLVACALLACYLPAVRAARLDPRHAMEAK